ncbi:hypothetical protein Tco_0186364 [Tanacetum coccineum]
MGERPIRGTFLILSYVGAQMHKMLQTLAVPFLCITPKPGDRQIIKDVVAMQSGAPPQGLDEARTRAQSDPTKTMTLQEVRDYCSEMLLQEAFEIGALNNIQTLVEVWFVVREEWIAEVFNEELIKYQHDEEQILPIGLACVARVPDMRPSIDDVIKMIVDLRFEDLSEHHLKALMSTLCNN